MSLYTLTMFLFAFVSESWMMFLFLIPYCLAGIAGPALRAIIAGHVLPTEQGEIQGTIASLMSAATIIGPPVMSSLFYYFTHQDAPFEFPGMPFILGGILMMSSGIVSYVSLKKYSNNN